MIAGSLSVGNYILDKLINCIQKIKLCHNSKVVKQSKIVYLIVLIMQKENKKYKKEQPLESGPSTKKQSWPMS